MMGQIKRGGNLDPGKAAACRRKEIPDSRKRVLVTASVASMVDLFFMENIRILCGQGWQVDVAANFYAGNITNQKRVAQFRRELTRMGITVYDVPVPRKITDVRNIVRAYRVLKRICMQNKYGLLHTQSPIGGAVSRLAAKKSRKYGTKVIYTAHGFHFYKGAPFYQWLLFYPAERWLSRYTDFLLTINQEDFLRAKAFPAGRVFYVPGIGVDLEAFRFRSEMRDRMRKTFGFTEKEFVVLSVGQLSKRKNQETVIRAMALVKNQAVRYVVVGLGEYRHRYRDLVRRLGLEKKVVLAGYRGDVRDVLQMADCFAFPSRQEGLPAALMEAMAAGVPAVCSRVRGNRDLIRDGIDGILLESDDVYGFAGAIERLAAHPQLADRYQASAGKRVAAFSKKRVCRQMERMYEMAGGKNGDGME